MSYEIVHGDITTMRVDAIVNAANRTLLGGGGLDGRIHRAAGPELLKECRTLNGCETGNAKITNAYNLPCKYVIHAVGPAWADGHSGEATLLSSCYRRSLEIAAEYHLESIAFPLISAESNGCPKHDALNIALKTVQKFLSQNDMHVYIVLYDKTPIPINQRLHQQLEWFVSHHLTEYFSDSLPSFNRALKRLPFFGKSTPTVDASCENLLDDIATRLNRVDESFSQSVLRLIDEKGLTDVQCYNRANIDRKLFSKLRSNIHYKPSKPTALALAIALELNIDEARKLIEKAGYALSRSSKFDIIIEFFIENHRYDINEINEALYNYDQPTLGGC